MAWHPSHLLHLMPSLQEGGKRLVDAAELNTLFNTFFVASQVTANNPPTLLTAGINMVNEIVSNGAVLLPNGLAGMHLVVINNVSGTQLNVNASPMNGATGIPDTIIPADSILVGDSVQQGPGSSNTYVCYAQGAWKQI